MSQRARRVVTAVWSYLKDWKNLLTHTIIGAGIVLIAVFLPVSPVLRVAILVVVVSANVLRMRIEKRRARRAETGDGA